MWIKNYILGDRVAIIISHTADAALNQLYVYK